MWQTIVQGIEATEIVPGRCEVIDEEQPFGCVVDAADTPDALSRLLDNIRECHPKRIILVLGCPGERDLGKRPFMGEVAHYKVCSCAASHVCRHGSWPLWTLPVMLSCL
jgi:UDP-N-acetylmuramyl tripeptide synthase